MSVGEDTIGLKPPVSWGGDIIGRTEVFYKLGWGHYRED